MFKKIALAAALVATASFATWDKFPVLEQGKGQAAVGINDLMQDKGNQLSLGAKGRFTVIQNLEVGLAIPYVIFTHWDGEDQKADGLADIGLMVRYQFMPTMNAFLDIALPTCNEDLCGEDGPVGFHFGAQYSQKFGIVNFGSELGLQLETAGDNDVTPPWELNIGVEADFEVNPVFVPYVGLETHTLLGKYSYKGDDASKSYTGKTGFDPYFGFTANITPQVYAGAQLRFGIGEDYYGENTLTTITAKVGFNF